MQIWDVLVRTLGLPDHRLDQSGSFPGCTPAGRARSTLGTTVVGEVGEIDPGVLDGLGIRERVAWLEVDLDHALNLTHGEHPYRPISRYPSSDLDLAFEVDETVPASRVAAAIRGGAGDLLVDLALFDVFTGAPVPDGHRSLAYRLRLQARDRTLTEADLTTTPRRRGRRRRVRRGRHPPRLSVGPVRPGGRVPGPRPR